MSSSTTSAAPAVEAPRLFPEDTVFGALRLMQQHGLTLLPVVDAADGRVLGEVHEAELYRLWEAQPLARMSEVLTARSTRRHPPAPAPRRRRRPWLH